MPIPSSLPIHSSVACTPSSTAFDVTRAVHCNTSGNMHAMFADGTTDTLACLAGVTYPFQVIKILGDSTGTYSLLR